MALPFKVGDVYGGLAECFGLLRDEGEALVFDFQVKDSLFGIAGKTREVRVPLRDLASVKLVRGWFGRSQIVLQAERLESVASLPGCDRGKVTLTVARADRVAAEAFVDRLHR